MGSVSNASPTKPHALSLEQADRLTNDSRSSSFICETISKMVARRRKSVKGSSMVSAKPSSSHCRCKLGSAFAESLVLRSVATSVDQDLIQRKRANSSLGSSSCIRLLAKRQACSNIFRQYNHSLLHQQTRWYKSHRSNGSCK